MKQISDTAASTRSARTSRAQARTNGSKPAATGKQQHKAKPWAVKHPSRLASIMHGVSIADQIAAIDAEIKSTRASFLTPPGPSDNPEEDAWAERRVACLEATRAILERLHSGPMVPITKQIEVLHQMLNGFAEPSEFAEEAAAINATIATLRTLKATPPRTYLVTIDAETELKYGNASDSTGIPMAELIAGGAAMQNGVNQNTGTELDPDVVLWIIEASSEVRKEGRAS